MYFICFVGLIRVVGNMMLKVADLALNVLEMT